MKFREFVQKELIPNYFVSVSCIALAMGVIGTLFEPDAKLGYGVLFSPFIYGLIAALIQLVSYSRKSLTPRQAITRQILHFILLEAGIMGVLYWLGALTSTGVTIALALSIPVIYAAVTAVMWMNDRRTTEAVNRALKELQQRNAESNGAL